MKKIFLPLMIFSFLVLILGSWSWAQIPTCPQAPKDRGECDTLFVEPWAADLPFGGTPDYVRVPIFIYHDVPEPMDTSGIDSIAGIVVPLCFTHTNPTKYCSTSAYYNTTSVTSLARSIFRDVEGIQNWMLDLWEDGEDPVWDTRTCNVARGDNWWLSLIPTGEPDRRYGEDGLTRLLATVTFKIQDTMHVCIDTCLWPPSSILKFARGDGQTYIPRHKLPKCFWVGPPRIEVISPDGGESWLVDSFHDITWLSENFSGANVKIDYSTNSGGDWTTVIVSTANDGSHPWAIPNTPSNNCRVKVSDLDDDPTDQSDADFSIIRPDFTIDVTPDIQTVLAGQPTTYNVTLTSVDGFASPCTLTTSNLPSGASASFNPNPLTPTGTSALQITTSESTPPDTYALIVTASELAKGITHAYTCTLIVTPLPDFAIEVNPDSLELSQGAQGNCEVILTALYGFTSSCTLSVSGLPQDATAEFAESVLVPTDTTALTINVGLTTPEGPCTLTIIAEEQLPGKGKVTHSKEVILVVRGPEDFSLDVIPDTIHIPVGTDSSCMVLLTSLNGFNSQCTLTVSGLPTGVEADFESPVLVPTDSTYLNISVSCTAHVNDILPYTLTVTATELSGDAKIQRSKPVMLFVDASTWDFYIQANPDTQGVVVGGGLTTYQVNLVRNTCFTLACTLAIINGPLPSGVTYSFSPNPIVPNETTTSVLTVNTTGFTPVGIHPLIIKAKCDSKPYSIDTVFLAVQDFGISTKPDTAYVTKGQSAGYVVTLTSLFGFDDPCTLKVSNLPAPPNSGVFDLNKLTPTDSTILTIYTTTQTDAGWYSVIITAQRMTAKTNGLSHSDTVWLKVNESSDVDDRVDNPNAPKTFALFQNQPNPFNPETHISYYLPKSCQVKLTIYNVLGQRVRTLVDGYQDAGNQTLVWNGRDDDNVPLSSGIYFYRLQADNFNQTRKMSLLK